ncbi:MAG: hypothetical protein OIF48_18385 [Silicimonas sp.]|nr:hypothetical protein [Silicimonas sp.]
MDIAQDPSLPALREDLTIAPGAPLLSGAPSWVIYDPIRHRYFQITQRTIEMIACWSAGSIGALLGQLRQERAVEAEPSDVEAVVRFLRANSLTAEGGAGTGARLAAAAARQRGRLWHWAAHKYVFFRVPLVRPQGFLEATQGFVAPLLSRGFVIFTTLIAVLALYLASRAWADVLAYGRAAFSLSGAWVYVLAIVFVKVLHELGHAYQAVTRGLRVPVMGVAFLVMFPLLYTDVTDAWRLRKRRDRIMVDAGGVMVELAIAAFATLLWCFLPDGAWRSAVFAVATVSWVFSLLVNLNPLMRFDGYYFLADALGVHNLQPRANAFGRWALREALFGLGDPRPERLSRRMTLFMVLYAYAVWIYRFFLFLGIALLVYALTFKALGILLFIVEIAVFIMRPIWREMREWGAMRDRIFAARRVGVTAALLVGLGALALWPMRGQVEAPAIVEVAAQQVVFAPGPVRLAEVLVEEGARVAPGDLMFRFEDPALGFQIEQSEVRIALREARLLSGAGDDRERAQRRVLTRQLKEERVRLAGLRADVAKLDLRAGQAGRVRGLARDLAPGVWVDRQAPLARIVGDGGLGLRGLISEADRRRIDLQAVPRFIPEDAALPVLDLGAPVLADYAVDHLADGYHAAQNGGGVDVANGQGDADVPLGVWYPLRASVAGMGHGDPAMVGRSLRGVVVLSTKPESWARRMMTILAKVTVREASL